MVNRVSRVYSSPKELCVSARNPPVMKRRFLHPICSWRKKPPPSTASRSSLKFVTSSAFSRTLAPGPMKPSTSVRLPRCSNWLYWAPTEVVELNSRGSWKL
jgi:hypothetical protein